MENELRKVIAESQPRLVKELASYIEVYCEEAELFDRFIINDAIEAWGGGAE